jgi:release factor glutamine methyltransferase
MDRLDIDSVTLPSEMGKNINIFSALKQALRQLDSISTSTLEAEILLSYVLKKPRSFLYAWPEQTLSEQQLLEFESLLSRRIEGEPIAYITGQREFWSLPFHVNRHTLIPRPETEELVHIIIQDNQSFSNLKVLDIGTGTGVISISLMKHLKKADVYAIDISKKALETAEKNAVKQNQKIKFISHDILTSDPSGIPCDLDIIVSNPPYVRLSEKGIMKDNVVKYEPHQALFVKDSNPLIFYESIIKLANTNLKFGGTIYVEINEFLGKETKQVFADAGYKKVQLIKDMQGKDRYIKTKKE